MGKWPGEAVIWELCEVRGIEMNEVAFFFSLMRELLARTRPGITFSTQCISKPAKLEER